MTKSVDPDQLASQKPTDLDLHCLLRQGMLCSAREGLTGSNVRKCTLGHVCKAKIQISQLICAV